MPQIQVIVPTHEGDYFDPDTAGDRIVEVPDDVPMRVIAPYLLIQSRMPIVNREGQRYEWKFWRYPVKPANEFTEILPDQTLAQAGVCDGDRLNLVPFAVVGEEVKMANEMKPETTIATKRRARSPNPTSSWLHEGVREEFPMAFLQTYETTITDVNNYWRLAFLVVPRRSTEVHGVSYKVSDLANSLAIKLGEKVKPSGLSSAIGSLIWTQKHGGDAVELWRNMQATGKSTVPEGLESALDFAEEISFLELIPFEQSPLEPTALSTLLAKAGGMGLGAFAGWVIAGSTPLLLITLPAGMIICGAAAGLATGLEEGLRRRISWWLTGRLKRMGVKAYEELDDAMRDFAEAFAKEAAKYQADMKSSKSDVEIKHSKKREADIVKKPAPKMKHFGSKNQ